MNICKNCGRTIFLLALTDKEAQWVHLSNYVAPCKPWLAVYAEPKKE